MKQYEVVIEVTKKYLALVSTEDTTEAKEKAVLGEVDSFDEISQHITIRGTPKQKS